MLGVKLDHADTCSVKSKVFPIWSASGTRPFKGKNKLQINLFSFFFFFFVDLCEFENILGLLYFYARSVKQGIRLYLYREMLVPELKKSIR